MLFLFLYNRSYLFANIAYYAVMPLSDIVDFRKNKTASAFATNFGNRAIGVAGKIIIPLFIVGSTFSAANGL